MPAERVSMRTIQDIVRLKWGCGLSNRQVADELGMAIAKNKPVYVIDDITPTMFLFHPIVVGCCRFQRHRVRCINETGGGGCLIRMWGRSYFGE